MAASEQLRCSCRVDRQKPPDAALLFALVGRRDAVRAWYCRGNVQSKAAVARRSVSCSPAVAPLAAGCLLW